MTRAPATEPKSVVNYVLRYGGMCRNCADEDGVCPSSGLPCENADKAVEHVLSALNYGINHGYIKSPFTPTIPPSLIALSEKATPGMWEAERYFDDRGRPYAEGARWIKGANCNLADEIDPDDAALICALVNWLRGEIEKGKA